MSSEPKLALYHYQTCWFCMRVRHTIARLGIQDQVELRDIRREPQHRADLAAARNGRTRVPILRITSETGEQWLAESRDINAYLVQRFGA